MQECFVILSSDKHEGHHWMVLDVPDGREWLKEMAMMYRGLRTATNFSIQDIELSGLKISADNIRRRLVSTQIPERGEGSFSVARSDFAEVIAHSILKNLFNTKFGYLSLRDRELIQLPGRGIDAIGIECTEDKIKLIFGEVKASAAKDSPPKVIDSGDDSLRGQHLFHLKQVEKTRNKVMQAGKFAKDREIQDLLFAAALSLETKNAQNPSIVSYSCLVRQKDKFTERDFGTFRKRPGDYSPSVIRFCIVKIPGDLEEVVSDWLKIAKEAEEV